MQGLRQSRTDFWTQYNTDAGNVKLIHEEWWKRSIFKEENTIVRTGLVIFCIKIAYSEPIITLQNVLFKDNKIG
jgi:hypothetical protein